MPKTRFRLSRPSTWPFLAYILVALTFAAALCAAVAQFYVTRHGGDFIDRFLYFYGICGLAVAAQAGWAYYHLRKGKARR